MTAKLGTQIKAARTHKGLRQLDIAEALGVSRAAVGQWEAGTNEPSLRNLMALEQLLEVSITAELRLENEKNSLLKSLRANSQPADNNKNLQAPRAGFDVAVKGVAIGIMAFVNTYAEGVVSEYVRRYEFFSDHGSIYALAIATSALSPRYEFNDIVYVDPDREPSLLDYGVFSIIIEADPEFEGYEIVRRLVYRDEARVILARLKPSQTEEFAISQIRHMSRIIREVELVQDGGK